MLVTNKKLDAKIIDCGLTQNKNGEPQPFIKFEITGTEGDKHQMSWFASLKSEKSTEFAVATLVKSGFKGEDFKDLNKGVVAFDGTLNHTVELEHPTDKDGKADTTKFRVKYINVKSAGLTKFEGAVPSQVALFARIKSELGVKTAKPTTTPNTDW